MQYKEGNQRKLDEYYAQKQQKRTELSDAGLSNKLIQDVMQGNMDENEALQMQKDSERAGGAVKRFATGAGKAIAETTNALYKGASLFFAS